MNKQRERLVELLNCIKCNAESCSAVENGRCGDLDNLDRCQIEAISDAILENGVIVPPCKVGQDIYTIQGDEVTKHFVIEVARHNNGKTYCKYVPYDKKGNVQWFYVQSSFTEDAIGKTVFLTKEEAEAKLKEGVQE